MSIRFAPVVALAGLAVLSVVAPALAQDTGHSPQHAQTMKMEPAAADTVKAGDLTLTAPWSRATPGGAKVGGGFIRITNTGSTPDKLIGGTTDAAARFEVHEMSVTDGIMKMRPVSGGLVIGPGETVELKPGGYHVMFMDIKAPFKQGDEIRATLQFEKAGKVDVGFRVGGIAGGGAPQHKGH
ncbi:MAG: copper chaperone PCu(A)C [Xanthobacteraceae bacterium]|nr:MAG: copper chaperone PCu(A)C [Xanthobacteraceae bacterium]